MTKRDPRICILVGLFLLVPCVSSAGVGVVLGTSFPVGEFGDVAHPGVFIAGAINDAIHQDYELVFRVSFNYNDSSVEFFNGEFDIDYSLMGATAHIRRTFRDAYVDLGTGLYMFRSSIHGTWRSGVRLDSVETEFEFGMNFGAGVQLPPRWLAAEAAFHVLFDRSRVGRFVNDPTMVFMVGLQARLWR